MEWLNPSLALISGGIFFGVFMSIRGQGSWTYNEPRKWILYSEIALSVGWMVAGGIGLISYLLSLL